MITVHHLNNSRSQRVLWMLEELGIPYEIKKYQRNPRTMLAPPELKAVHPLGKSPVITDGGNTVAESGAILEYLVARYGNGRFIPSAGTPEQLRYTYWMHYAEGTLMPLMVMSLILGQVDKKAPWLVKPIAKGIVGQIHKAYLGPNTRVNLDYVENELGKSTWFAGEELSAADVQMSFAMEAATVRANANAQYPRISAFVQRIRARPAYQRALEKGGPFALG